MPKPTPALRGEKLYDHRDTLLAVYPELSTVIDNVHRRITDSGCTGCAQRKHTRHILTALMNIRYDGRDLTPLESFMDQASIERLQRDVAPDPREPLEIPREECPHCVQKHLCACFILLNEYIAGYEGHAEYARAHYEEAVREGYKGVPLHFDDMTVEKALELSGTITTHLDLKKDKMFLIGALAVLGELTEDEHMKRIIRSARTTMQPIKPPKRDKTERIPLSGRVLIRSKLCPGDILMLTAAVRDLKKAAGKQLDIHVDTTNPELWENNPYITPGRPKGSGFQVINARYTDAVRSSNQRPHHFIEGYRFDLEERLKIRIPATAATGCVFPSDAEREWGPWMQSVLGDPKAYWLIAAGGKTDVTNKWWPREYWQEVVDRMKERITIVQVGRRKGDKRLEHVQYELDGVVDLVNGTDHRQLIQLLYHSMGATCGITYLMHLSAALEPLPGTTMQHRPCVVIAGGREPAHWEMYQHHIFLHNCGLYSCNRRGGCWKARTERLDDGNKARNSSLCAGPVQMAERKHPKCMVDITPDMVVDAMNRYLDTMRSPYGKLPKERR